MIPNRRTALAKSGGRFSEMIMLQDGKSVVDHSHAELMDGVYRYQATRGPQSVLQGAVAQFVDNTLQGSVSPFVAYLSQRQQVSDNELAELEALVAQLQSRRHEG